MHSFKKLSQYLPLLFALVFFMPSMVHAEEPIYTGTFSNRAVGGFDTVAYFTAGKAVKGDSAFKAEYKGAEWLFSSAENLAAFQSNPEKYAPQYGGYCAYALAEKNQLVSAHPESWHIDQGKLYLNYDNDIRDVWLKDKANFISKADGNWPQHAK